MIPPVSFLNTPMRPLQECERTDVKMSCLNDWTAEQLCVPNCSYLFSVCIIVPCSHLPAPVPSSRLDSAAPALLAVTVLVVVAHPLMSKIANLCFASALCCVLSRLVPAPFDPPSVLPFHWLWCQHWLAFALNNHALPKNLIPPNFTLTPSKSWLAVAMTTSCCPACAAPTSCLLRLWHPALPMSCTNWWLPPRTLSVIDCAAGNGVVHQNLGLLLTGTTSARSVSTRSRERRFPWATTPPSHRREYYSVY